MPIYKLRNGLSVDFVFEKPTPSAVLPAKVVFDKNALFSGFLDANLVSVLEGSQPPVLQNAMRMKAKAKVSGAPSETIMRCALRFMQFMTVKNFNVNYHGKRPSEGSVTWSWSGRILERLTDSLVKDGINSFPFQFPDLINTRTPPDTLIANLGDTPGAHIPLAHFNKESNKTNYLFIFSERASFETIATFVHADGSREMLESWKWNFKRIVQVRWEKLEPKVDRTNHAAFFAADNSVPMFGKDNDFEGTIKTGLVANTITNESMKDIRNNPNISYLAAETANIAPGPGFWDP